MILELFLSTIFNKLPKYLKFKIIYYAQLEHYTNDICIDWLLVSGYYLSMDLLYYRACKIGNKSIMNRYYTRQIYTLKYLIKYKHYDIIEWFLTNFCDSNKNVEILKWSGKYKDSKLFKSTIKKINNIESAYEGICLYDKSKYINFLDILNIYYFPLFCKSGNIEPIKKYLSNNEIKDFSKLIYNCCKSGIIENIQFFQNYADYTYSFWLAKKIKVSDLKLINGYNKNNLYIGAINYNNKELLDYIGYIDIKEWCISIEIYKKMKYRLFEYLLSINYNNWKPSKYLSANKKLSAYIKRNYNI